LPQDNRGPPVKLYYRIGEVAGLVGVEPHVLRYWESEFPTIRPQKSRSGQRVYSRRDVEKLLRVKDLLYAQRFTIAGARQRLRGASAEPAAVLHQQDAAQQVEVETQTPGGSDEVERAAQDRVRVAATTLRSTLLSVREQVFGLLDAMQSGTTDPNP
jgi:DNA-binding transcriptional MerR regulator